MKFDVIVAGVGGQGIISIAAVLARTAMATGLNIKQSEIHGMAQRGGSVHSHLRVSSLPVASDVIPLRGADMILSMEPMESLRYLPYLSPEGWLITNEVPFKNIAAYPDVDTIHAEVAKLPRRVMFDAEKLSRENGSPRSVNMAMLGAASLFINLELATFERAIAEQFGRKGEGVIEKNKKVFHAARDLAGELTAAGTP